MSFPTKKKEHCMKIYTLTLHVSAYKTTVYTKNRKVVGGASLVFFRNQNHRRRNFVSPRAFPSLDCYHHKQPKLK